MGKFFSARAAAVLRRDQEAGYHWGHLVGEGKIHCTCAFILDTNDNETLLAMAYPEVDLDVKPLVYIIGHRNLPSCKGITMALIVEHKLLNMGQDQEATAFCQKCGKVVQAVPLEEATSFVETHNKMCVRTP